jgi:RNA recognition motif-containing protein
VPPTVPEEDLRALFERYGRVVHINVFRRWATAKTSKGCGTVQLASPQEAGAALAALNGLHAWSEFTNGEGPMVVEWKDDRRLSTPDKDASGAGGALGWAFARGAGAGRDSASAPPIGCPAS